MKKSIANIFHHTHWDNEWYFSEEDSLVQFTFGIKEMFKAFDKGVIKHFFIDGQTAILDDYLKVHPEDKELIAKLIKEKKIFVGPFHTQIDSFITSGESIINNLRLGLKKGKEFGGVSLVAYLPDSFGQTQDYPKIFKGLGISDFIFRRGMGDEHNLPLDFYWQSNNGDSVLVTTLYCGYGFATAPFVNGTLIKGAGIDYDGNDIASQLKKLSDMSSLDNEFLLPIGNDQTPVIWNFYDRIKEYNQISNEYEFKEVTIDEYMQKLRRDGKDMKTYQGEFISPQYHRVHKSLYSARADIKALQDRVERLMTYELQPLMTMLNELGLDYDEGLVDYVWDLLGRSQTHSSATNNDATNEFIYNRTKRSFNVANASKVYLARKIAISLPINNNSMPLVVFNTLMNSRNIDFKLVVYTKNKDFNLKLNGANLSYAILNQEKVYGGTVRKDEINHKDELYFYATTINTTIKDMKGFSYQTVYINDGEKASLENFTKQTSSIENNFYSVSLNNGKINITDKINNITLSNAISLENSGDEGDNYDYSYPTNDLFVANDFSSAKVVSCQSSIYYSEIILEGEMKIPANLLEREKKTCSSTLKYNIKVSLKANDSIVYVSGTFNNNALNHRVRVLVNANMPSKFSYDGTAFGYIKRETLSPAKQDWRKNGYLEEPDQINPLLNHVSLVDSNKVVSVFTRGLKEYEITGSSKENIALTVFRAVGHLGLPDLNRRPGRASGIAEKIIESPLSQMIGDNHFELGISFFKDYTPNLVSQTYVNYACENTYYQNQHFNRVVFPISYFETNPMLTKVEPSYSLASIDNSEAVFGTLKISDDRKGIILRTFNCNEDSCKMGEITSTHKAVSTCSLDENVLSSLNNNKLETLKVGEICNIYLQK